MMKGGAFKKDTVKAVDLFDQASKAGEVRACYNLGSIFALGSGEVEMDRKRAGLEFKAAAGLGYVPAMTALSKLAESADPVDHGSAADWYEKGHETGDVVGTTNLAHAYVKGRGRSVSWVRARVLYTEAAARGYFRAFNDLGVMHEEGYGVHIDLLTAYSFYLQAVKGDYPKAGKNLAQLIIKAHFTWMLKHAALDYCIWAARNAPDEERADF
ncbi:tetratricopeptide repeat protein [Planktotalea sp.]|mgnify:CR=1 FL=1|uniref:tetratricopeptide repeat protein n=1 Tax=Planktotalea sp. TaxID=2029877 RepID=UPI0025EADA64|nr:tetratricopeptide repeat protein [Planktotalea sp.]